MKSGKSLLLSENRPVQKKVLQHFRKFGVPSKIQIYQPYWVNNQTKSRIFRKINEWKNLSKLFPLATPLLFGNQTVGAINVDWKWRTKINATNNFEEACGIFSRRYIPAVFLEGFRSLNKCTQSSPSQFLYTANALHASLPFKFLVASHSESTVLCHQHGGGYGMDLCHVVEDYERKASNTFYTWGWQEDENTRPLPIPPRIKASPVEKRHGVLLKCVNYPRHVYRIMFQHMGDQNSGLIDQTIRFARALQHLNFEVSHSPNDYGWNVKQRFLDAGIVAPEKTQNDGDYAVHTCNYLGTSWLRRSQQICPLSVS